MSKNSHEASNQPPTYEEVMQHTTGNAVPGELEKTHIWIVYNAFIFQA